MQASGLKEPVFEMTTFFRAVFYRDPRYSLKNPGRESATQKTTQKTTQKIIELIKGNPIITRRELAELIGLSEDGIKYHLTILQKNGLIKRIGPDKGGRWEV